MKSRAVATLNADLMITLDTHKQGWEPESGTEMGTGSENLILGFWNRNCKEPDPTFGLWNRNRKEADPAFRLQNWNRKEADPVFWL